MMSDRIPGQYERTDQPTAGYGENISRKTEEMLGHTTGRDTSAQEFTTQRGMGTGMADPISSTGRAENVPIGSRSGLRDEYSSSEYSSGRSGEGMGMASENLGRRGVGDDEYSSSRGMGREGDVGREQGTGRERTQDFGRGGGLGSETAHGARGAENRGVEDEFISSNDPMLGKQRSTGETYGSRSAKEESQRTTGAMGGPPGTAGLSNLSSTTTDERQRHYDTYYAGGLQSEDIGDDPTMSGHGQGTATQTGSDLGAVSSMEGGRRDDQSYGSAYAGGGQPKEKRDSITGKFMERAGGILGSSKMEEMGHERREARQRPQ